MVEELQEKTSAASPASEFWRYQLARLRRLLIRTGAEEISWALGAAFLKGPLTVEMVRTRDVADTPPLQRPPVAAPWR